MDITPAFNEYTLENSSASIRSRTGQAKTVLSKTLLDEILADESQLSQIVKMYGETQRSYGFILGITSMLVICIPLFYCIYNN